VTTSELVHILKECNMFIYRKLFDERSNNDTGNMQCWTWWKGKSFNIKGYCDKLSPPRQYCQYKFFLPHS